MTKIIVNLDNAKHKIPKEIYGQFAEHLGAGIYGGVYVGEESEIDNIRGIRQDVVTALKNIRVPVIRWPGGCFADAYHWRDGIGPKESRKPMVNSHWGGVVEDNSFGTHEFFDLCEQVGAEPYVNGNLGSGDVLEMQEWVEYITCDNPASPMAKLRTENGREEPWSLKWFGIGNENWGCGGNMCSQYYAQEYKRFQTYIHNYGDNKVAKIACGPSVNNYQWTESLMQNAAPFMDHLSLHHYAFDGTWEDKGRALTFTEDAYYHLLSNAYYMEDLIDHHLSIMDRYDAEKRIGLIVDEWGAWHRVEEGTNPGFLYQQNTIRDALVASMSLDIFNRHADRITMCNIAQMINVLQSMILTDGSKMLLTPTYHVFDLYKDHMEAMFLDTWNSANDIHYDATLRDSTIVDVDIPAISLTASRNDAGEVNVTISNFDYSEEQAIDLELFALDENHQVNFDSARIITSNEGAHAYNSFESPEDVAIQDYSNAVNCENGCRFVLPAASVVSLRFK